MHGQIDAAIQQSVLDLLGEQPLAAHLAQRAILDAVTAGLDDDRFEKALGQAMDRDQPPAHLVGLGQRQRAAARTDADGSIRDRLVGGLHGVGSQ
jgi:hypothetical protein